MANELNIALSTGLTVTAQRYQAGAAVGSPISLSEVGSSGFYTGNMTGTAGTYQLVFISASSNVGSGSIVWDGSAEVPISTLTAAQVNAECDTALADVGLTTTVTGRIDVATSTRLATSGYTVPPTATQNATAVRTELSTELARIDVATSTRLASASYTAPDNSGISAIKAKTDNLPSDPAGVSDIPTATENADAVRTELATEMARIDVAVSTRMPATGPVPTPPSSDISRASVNDVPGQLDIYATVGDDWSMPLNFDLNMTGYSFESWVLVQQAGTTKKQELTVTETDLASGIITLSLTDAQTTNLGEINKRPWYLVWTTGGNETRTVLAGNFSLNRR